MPILASSILAALAAFVAGVALSYVLFRLYAPRHAIAALNAGTGSDVAAVLVFAIAFAAVFLL